MPAKREDQELITRVAGDAPAAQMMRRYWLPALWTEELPELDGAPVRVRMFGENLVAFRDTSGTVGLVAEGCPHRLASLALGRNEEGGLRCIYHGWKFGADGSCLDMPTEPGEHGFRQRMRIASYPVREAGGLVWAYLGPAGSEPAFSELRLDVGAAFARRALEIRRACELLAGRRRRDRFGAHAVLASRHARSARRGDAQCALARPCPRDSKRSIRPTAFVTSPSGVRTWMPIRSSTPRARAS